MVDSSEFVTISDSVLTLRNEYVAPTVRVPGDALGRTLWKFLYSVLPVCEKYVGMESTGLGTVKGEMTGMAQDSHPSVDYFGHIPFGSATLNKNFSIFATVVEIARHQGKSCHCVGAYPSLFLDGFDGSGVTLWDPRFADDPERADELRGQGFTVVATVASVDNFTPEDVVYSDALPDLETSEERKAFLRSFLPDFLPFCWILKWRESMGTPDGWTQFRPPFWFDRRNAARYHETYLTSMRIGDTFNPLRKMRDLSITQRDLREVRGGKVMALFCLSWLPPQDMVTWIGEQDETIFTLDLGRNARWHPGTTAPNLTFLDQFGVVFFSMRRFMALHGWAVPFANEVLDHVICFKGFREYVSPLLTHDNPFLPSIYMRFARRTLHAMEPSFPQRYHAARVSACKAFGGEFFSVKNPFQVLPANPLSPSGHVTMSRVLNSTFFGVADRFIGASEREEMLFMLAVMKKSKFKQIQLYREVLRPYLEKAGLNPPSVSKFQRNYDSAIQSFIALVGDVYFDIGSFDSPLEGAVHHTISEMKMGVLAARELGFQCESLWDRIRDARAVTVELLARLPR